MFDYKRLIDEELEDFLSRVFVQLEPGLSQSMMSCAKELLEHRSKIANGTLVELPCKVGDTVYTVKYSHYYNHWFIDRHEVTEIIIDKNDIYLKDYYGIYLFEPFLTEAEAEADLAKKRGGNDNND